MKDQDFEIEAKWDESRLDGNGLIRDLKTQKTRKAVWH